MTAQTSKQHGSFEPVGMFLRARRSAPLLIAVSAILLAALPSPPLYGQMITQSQVANKREKNKERLLKITAEEFRRKATITDDDLETIATISTQRGFPSMGGLFDVQGADVYLRAHIDKRTGTVTYQLYALFWYQEVAQRRYAVVNYQDGDGIRTADLTPIDARIIACDQYSNVLGCKRAEDVAFDVPGILLRQIAAAPNGQFWRFKFRATAGDDWEDMIAPAEAAGLLAAVDAYKMEHNLP